jgi:type IV secretion system protein VirB5
LVTGFLAKTSGGKGSSMKIIIKMIIQKIILFFSLLLCTNQQVLANLAVIDAANLENSARQVAAWQEQLSEMRNQLEQARRQYTAITGNRDLGMIFNNPELRKYLPPEYQNIYNSMTNSNYGISGSIKDILAAEQLTGSIDQNQKIVEDRRLTVAVTNKAVGLKAYEGAEARLQQIDALMSQINKTQDLKAISELQARIAVEQAAIQNEHNKLQIISQLQIAEQRLIKEQRHSISRRILNSNNSTMPRIK